MVVNQDILFHKLHVILHRSLVESRNLALSGNCEQLVDLADTFEIVPEMLTRWKDDDLDRIRRILAIYQAKYPGAAYDYLSILEMEASEFQTLFQIT